MEWAPSIGVIIRLRIGLRTFVLQQHRLWQQLPMNPSYICAPHGSSPSTDLLLKTNVSISLPSPTSDNAMNMSIGFLSGFLLVRPHSLEIAKITYFELVRGWVTIFCEKSCNLSLVCTICENFSFPSFTVLERAKSLILRLVRGCVTIFCEKSCNLFLFCTICENFNFPSFTV